MEYKKNNEISGTDVLLINDATNKPVKTLLVVAKNMAREKQLDLVQFSSGENDIPICKIIDYSKFLYQQKKKAKETARNQVIIGFKQLKFSPNISDHDLGYRFKQIESFLREPNKVRITVTFHGRQKLFQIVGERLLDRVIERFNSIASVESKDRTENKEISITLAPLSNTILHQKANNSEQNL